MSRSLRSDHGNINVLRRYDTSEMNIEAMSKHQHVAFFQVRLDIFFVQSSLLLIIDQDHDDVCSSLQLLLLYILQIPVPQPLPRICCPHKDR